MLRFRPKWYATAMPTTGVAVKAHRAFSHLLQLGSCQVGMADGTAFQARDLFARVDLGPHPTGTFQTMLDATSILMLKLTPL